MLQEGESFSFLLVPSELDAGSVGLALSYSVTLMGMFQWGVRQSAEVENMVRCSPFLSSFLFISLITHRCRTDDVCGEGGGVH